MLQHQLLHVCGWIYSPGSYLCEQVKMILLILLEDYTKKRMFFLGGGGGGVGVFFFPFSFECILKK